MNPQEPKKRIRNPKGYGHTGEDHHSSKPSAEQVIRIRANLDNQSKRKRARRYMVSKTTIRQIDRGEIWKHLIPIPIHTQG